jgi:hypothetical protein
MPHKIHFSEEIVKDIINEYQQGASTYKLAEKYGFKCPKSITRLLRKAGITIRDHLAAGKFISIFDDAQIQQIIEMHKNPLLSVRAIAKKMFCDPVIIKKYLERFDVYDITKYDKYLIDKFDQIDTEEKAYWLGFLAADGCVKDKDHLSLALAEKDKHHLEKFKEFIGVDYAVTKVKSIKTNNKKSETREHIAYEYVVSSIALIQSLKKHNLVPRKSLILAMPNTIPDHLIRHYLRGLIDGDGWFSNSGRDIAFGLISSVSMCESAQTILMTNCNLDKTKLKIMTSKITGEPYARLSYTGGQQVPRISDYLYQDATILLQRKRDVVLNFLAERKK